MANKRGPYKQYLHKPEFEVPETSHRRRIDPRLENNSDDDRSSTRSKNNVDDDLHFNSNYDDDRMMEDIFVEEADNDEVYAAAEEMMVCITKSQLIYSCVQLDLGGK